MGLYGFIRANPRVMRLREIEAALRLAYKLEAVPADLQQQLGAMAAKEHVGSGPEPTHGGLVERS